MLSTSLSKSGRIESQSVWGLILVLIEHIRFIEEVINHLIRIIDHVRRCRSRNLWKDYYYSSFAKNKLTFDFVSLIILLDRGHLGVSTLESRFCATISGSIFSFSSSSSIDRFAIDGTSLSIFPVSCCSFSLKIGIDAFLLLCGSTLIGSIGIVGICKVWFVVRSCCREISCC